MAVQNDPGLGSKFSKKVARLINEDGSYNIHRIGGITNFKDVYKWLLEVNWPVFFAILFGVFCLLNLFFACVYLLIGIEDMSGFSEHNHPFFDAFFFSVQTFTTVGYGAISPNSIAANLVSTVEAFSGLLSFSIATGLLYGRFSKPSSKIRFSKNIIVTPFEGENAIMFKMVNERNTILLNTKVKATLTLDSINKDKAFNKEYYNLQLETDFVNFFPLTWTLVHKINSKSPLHGVSFEELKQRNAEVILLVESFEETFGQIVYSKHSYAGNQWLENVKFERNFIPNDKGEIQLFVDQIDQITKV